MSGGVIAGPAADVESLLAEAPAEPERNGRPKRDSLAMPGLIGDFNRAYTDTNELVETYSLPYRAEKDRWRFKGSTAETAGLVELGEGVWFSQHATDPAHNAGHAVTAYDLVRLHRFSDLDTEAPKGTPVHELPSSRAMDALAAEDPKVRAAVLAEFDVVSKPAEAAREDPEYQKLLTEQLRYQRARSEAAEMLAKEGRADMPVEAPVFVEQLADEPVDFLVDQLVPRGFKVLISAASKTGKTVFALNLAAALSSGEPALGEYAAEKIDGTIMFLNYELIDAMFRADALSIGVEPGRLLTFQGRRLANPFEHPEQREKLVETARQHSVEVLIVDPLSNAFPWVDQDNNSQVRRALAEVDLLARDCGATTQIVCAHAGKDKSRGTRGAGTYEDDPDTIIRLSKESEHGPRRFTVGGRGPKITKPVKTVYDEQTKRVTVAPPEAPKREANTFSDLSRDEADHQTVLEVIGEHPGSTRERLQASAGLAHGRFNKTMKRISRDCMADPDHSAVQRVKQGRQVLHYLREQWEDSLIDPESSEAE